MNEVRFVAIPTEVAKGVRETLVAPKYGFPAHAEVATDNAPCRHCLQTFKPGEERRILFTYDRFHEVDLLPQPGPVYIHENECSRYPEDAEFPEALRSSPRTLEAYARGRRFLAQAIVKDGNYESAIKKLFADSATEYIQVNSTTAGCFTFRIERA